MPSDAELEVDPHGALAPLARVAALTRARVAVVPVSMVWNPRSRFLEGPIERLLRQPLFLIAHIRLVGELWRRRDHDLIIVREFLTQLLAVVWPAIWPLRRRVHFLINHNLQEAHQRFVMRWLLRLLCRTGLRLACFESTAGFAELGVHPPPGRIIVLPHPINLQNRQESRRDRGEPLPLVGVVGSVRAEKGTDALLDSLVRARDAGRLRARLMFACPEAEPWEHWRSRGVDVVDSGPREAYEQALAACDVVVVNYRRQRYYYRPSGVLADAVSHGTPVVCPNFPIMGRQLSEPASVGATFDSLDLVAEAIVRALALHPHLAHALERHAELRGAEAIAHLLDGFVDARMRRAVGNDAPTHRPGP